RRRHRRAVPALSAWKGGPEHLARSTALRNRKSPAQGRRAAANSICHGVSPWLPRENAIGYGAERTLPCCSMPPDWLQSNSGQLGTPNGRLWALWWVGPGCPPPRPYHAPSWDHDDMRLRISPLTPYRYGVPASSAIQILRLTPRNHDGQHVINWRIDVS